jgi:hypothetical protein
VELGLKLSTIRAHSKAPIEDVPQLSLSGLTTWRRHGLIDANDANGQRQDRNRAMSAPTIVLLIIELLGRKVGLQISGVKNLGERVRADGARRRVPGWE